MSGFAGGPMVNAPERFLSWRWEDEEDEETKKLTYTPDSKRPNGGTFTLQKEDHTMGNLIRLQLLRDDQVRFAGYRVPHPLILQADIRVETMDSKITPVNVFDAALEDLRTEVDRLKNQFDQACTSFEVELDGGEYGENM
jgi:DNA-directed RNA polymerase II subunit RPB11